MAYTAFSGDATQGSAGGDLSGGEHIDVFIPEIWGQSIYRYFEKNLVLKPFFDDYSSMIQGAGDVLHIPTVQEVASARKAENNGVAYSVNTETKIDLLIDQHMYSAKLFEDIAMVQSSEQLFSKYTESMAYALAKAVDTEIEGALQGLGTTQSLSADNTMSNADIETAIGTMLANDIPLDQCAFFVNPLIYADLLNSKGFVNAVNSPANYATSGTLGNVVGAGLNDGSAMSSGLVGSIFGCPVFVTSLIGSGTGTGIHAGYLAHKSAIAVAVQQGVRVQSEYSVDYLATKVVADTIYGAVATTASHVKGIEFLNP
tara:strand:+ start:9320 stop:10264 length:945 start_codon:yes stop_codon:yes gene_type:complete